MDLNLTGKVAFVTGASKGIGREVARTLAQEGCDVVITARGQEELEKTAAELSAETGRRVVAHAGDMSDSTDVDRCVRAAIDDLGAIDILVTCAGSSPGGLLEELTDEQWLQSLNLKFMGYVRTVRAVVPHMVANGKGAIVLVVGNDGL
jgi:NAD(P)-dependent dehydrogenase (short-subunit alcohol dehydrogenase family)